LRQHEKRLEEIERDRVAVLDHYAALAPEALDFLTSEERHQLYKMLRLRADASQDGSVKISGVFGDNSFCKSGLAPQRATSRNLKCREMAWEKAQALGRCAGLRLVPSFVSKIRFEQGGAPY
jgi:hypothetical protein